MWGMSAHNLRPDMKVYGAERRAVWRFRNHVLAAANFSEAEILRPALDIVAREPGKLRLLFVRGNKRHVLNQIELLDALRREFAAELYVEAIVWPTEDQGGFREEVRQQMQTHIFLSTDGTVALTMPFLPRGAVHINLGVARPWGSQIQCDFLYSAVDHVRVLFYGGLASGEHSSVSTVPDRSEEGFTVPPAELAPLVRRAIELVRGGFSVPTAPDANMAPSARLLAHLLGRHPDFAGLLHSGQVRWAHFKTSEPYEAFAPRLFRSEVAKGNSSAADAFDAEVAAFCEAHGC